MKPIHNLLRERLYRTQKPIIEHPPIDLLSAFSERALGRSDSASVLEHLSHCTDCREIAFLAIPEAESASISAVGKHTDPRSSASWISWPVFRWGAVAACAVIAVATMRLHPGYHAVHPEAIIAASQDQQASRQRNQSSQMAGANSSGEKLSITDSLATRTAGKDTSSSGAAAVRSRRSIPGKAKDVPQVLSARPENGAGQTNFAANGVSSNAKLPNLPPRWTLTAEGDLQRSMDGGITWQQIQVSHDRAFRAVFAEGRSIWVGGQKGVLFHSSDAGQHWAQMKRTAKGTLPNSDITGIEFEDNQHGKITTASNELWKTSDAGRSWEKQ
jgi:Photosynthesis system II assembly factor YCF48